MKKLLITLSTTCFIEIFGSIFDPIKQVYPFKSNSKYLFLITTVLSHFILPVIIILAKLQSIQN